MAETSRRASEVQTSVERVRNVEVKGGIVTVDTPYGLVIILTQRRQRPLRPLRRDAKRKPTL